MWKTSRPIVRINKILELQHILFIPVDLRKIYEKNFQQVFWVQLHWNKNVGERFFIRIDL